MSRETVLFIMPAYNEEKNIENTLIKWIPVVKSIPGSKMLIFDGNSNDNTIPILKKISKKHSKLIGCKYRNFNNHGDALLYIYRYVTTLNYNWVFQTDSDGHFAPSDFYKLWDARNNSPFILGFRQIRDDTLLRKALSKIIRGWVYILFRIHIKDPNIPFRLIKISYLKKILPKVKSGVFAPNIHLSILAAKDKLNLHHIAVEHKNLHKKNNNIRIFKGAFQGFFELLIFAFETV